VTPLTQVHPRAPLSMRATRSRKLRAAMQLPQRSAESSTKPSIYLQSYEPARFSRKSQGQGAGRAARDSEFFVAILDTRCRVLSSTYVLQ
jgi:hypothetical protein